MFFECFLCVFFVSFFSSFFTFFTYSFHYNTIQNNTKEVCTNILRLLILCRNSLSTLCGVCVFVTGGHLNNYLLHLRFHCNVSIPVLPLYFLHVPASGSPVILGTCCNGIMSQLYNIRHLKTDISSGDVSFHRCPDQLNRLLSAFRFLSYPIKIIKVIIHKHKISKSKDKKMS